MASQDDREAGAQKLTSDRRGFIKGGAVIGAGIVGAGALAKGTGGASWSELFAVKAARAAGREGELSAHVPPGKLDPYYGFWSGGQSGEIRVLGVPSMRELMTRA